MNQARLTRRSYHSKSPDISFLGELSLRKARTHEFCGPARRTLAMLLAQRTQGPVFWIQPRWMPDRMNPAGMASFLDPSRFLFVTIDRAEDLLWSMEEVLRSGAAPLAVADLPGTPGLTAIRRLHLAAETGAEEGAHTPLGLILTPDRGGAQGVESRWHITPTHGLSSDRWQLSRLRARQAPEQSWTVFRDAKIIQLQKQKLK